MTYVSRILCCKNSIFCTKRHVLIVLYSTVMMAWFWRTVWRSRITQGAGPILGANGIYRYVFLGTWNMSNWFGIGTYLIADYCVQASPLFERLFKPTGGLWWCGEHFISQWQCCYSRRWLRPGPRVGWRPIWGAGTNLSDTRTWHVQAG